MARDFRGQQFLRRDFRRTLMKQGDGDEKRCAIRQKVTHRMAQAAMTLQEKTHSGRRKLKFVSA